ncbi:anti-sigma factor family protein [Actinoallomurus iriomotensis]|uniref:RNA polymerase subunit sigma n=1 Tax=Actinoallomurus iriomotensis TaxID=478107 RepID=A0A9W6S9N6_9ACTN|nr:zf-HC2 domain-containing protein [Actinoallomurus iriomotensis]GLY89914.1 RNA polymerase subunit sigma [Actinoallomurus iriomotensis]
MSVEHTDVGAYALGLLEDDDRRAFEQHVTGCAECTAELHGLAGMRALLVGVGPVEADEDLPDGVPDLLSRRRREDRRRRRGTLVIGLAAGVALVAGGVTAGAALVSPGGGTHQHGSPAADVLAKGTRHTATDPTTHAVAVVATRPETFGTEVGLDLAGIRGPLTCRLVAVLRSGRQQAVTEWAVPPKGYGVPGSRAHLQVHGGIAAPPSEVSRYDVLIEGGGRLVSIPV